MCKIYGINSWFFGRRTRLWNFIGFVRELDLAILREGGPQKLSQDQLRQVKNNHLIAILLFIWVDIDNPKLKSK